MGWANAGVGVGFDVVWIDVVWIDVVWIDVVWILISTCKLLQVQKYIFMEKIRYCCSPIGRQWRHAWKGVVQELDRKVTDTGT